MILKTTKLRDAISFALVAGVTSVVGTGVAFAQEQAATSLDRIEVTGSRIKRADIEGALPVTVIDRAQLQASGEVSVADYLRDTSFNSFGSYQSTSGSSAAGFTGISLRGMGSGRTLILIDGRRAPTAPMWASAGQDLNSIPLAAVERIEILSDGASAVYGSDAIGGVVNIITRKDFEGVEATYGMGSPSNPGGDTEEMSIVIGASGERGRVLAGASYSKRDEIFTRDRDYWMTIPGSSVYSNNFATSASTATSARLTHPVFGTMVPGDCSDGTNLFYNSGSGASSVCQYDHKQISGNLTSVENTSVFGRGDYQVNDDWLVYFAASVTKVESFGRFAPVPSSPWPGGAIVLAPGTPNHPGTSTAAGGYNPYYADYAQYANRNIYLFHRFASLGARDNQLENTTSSFLAGAEGRIGNVDLDFGARYVESRALNLGTNYVVGGLAQTQITNGNYNIYDPTATSETVKKGMISTISRDMRSTTKEVYASASFDLFSLPGGTSAMVVGAEHRKDTFQNIYDPLSEAGQIVGSSGNSASGGRDVTSAYAEVLLPVHDQVEIDIAGRYEKYSDYGNDFAPKISIRYQPLDSLTLRGSYGEGFRAPPLDILTAQPAFSAAATTDPATCTLLTGNPTCNTQVNTYSISNAGLVSEQSKQYTVGAVWDATDWLNLSLDYYNTEIDNSITSVGLATVVGCLRGSISICPTGLNTFPTGTTLPNASLGLGAEFDPVTGGIVRAQTGSANVGWLETEGYDFNARTNFDLGAWGNLRNHLSASYVANYASNGDQSVAGRPGYPRLRGSLSTVWGVGDWSVSWNMSYIASTQSASFREYRALARTPNRTATQNATMARLGNANKNLSSWITHNVQVSYNAPWNATVSLGVNNIADKDPVIDPYTQDFDPYLYDPWGRVPYFRYTQRF